MHTTASAARLRNPMDTHVTVLGVLYLGFSALSVMAAGLGFLALVGAGAMSGDLAAFGISTGVGLFIAAFILAIAIPGLLAGYGLLKRKEWARILTLVLSVLNLINIPFGTIVGAYGIWVLIHQDTKVLFGAPRQAPPA